MRHTQAQPIALPLRLTSDPTTITGLTPANIVMAKQLSSVPSFGQAAGLAIGYSATTSDGCVFLPFGPQTGNGDPIAGVLQQCQVHYPSGEVDTIQISSLPGLFPPGGEATPSGFYNPADMARAQVFFDSHDVEHVVVNAFYPVSNWQIYGSSGQGIQPALTVFTKVSGKWAYDPTLSLTADALYASNPTLANATGCIVSATNTFGETYYGARAITEISVLPNNQVACVQYFGECLFIVDMNLGKLVASYALPTISDTTGGSTIPAFSLAGRSVQADPTSNSPTDIRILWLFDLYQAAALTVTSVSSTNGLITITTSASHNYGIGQWARFTNLTSPFTALNSGIFAITSTPTAATFTIISTSITSGSASPPSATVSLQEGSPFVELTYNANNGDMSPTSQILLSDPNRGNVGTAFFDSVGNAVVDGSNPLIAFSSLPLKLYIKSSITGNRSYVDANPYNSSTFSTSYGTLAQRDIGMASTATSVYVTHASIANTTDGVIWSPTAASSNSIMRTKLTYPITTPTNLQPDPSFESPGTYSFRTFFSIGQYSTTYAMSGTHSVEVTTNFGSFAWPVYASPAVTLAENISVTAGQNYSASGWFLMPDAAGLCAIGLTFYDVLGNSISTLVSPSVWVPQSTTQWVYITGDFVAPLNAEFGVIWSRPAMTAAMTFQALNMMNVGEVSNRMFVDVVSFIKSPAQALSPIITGSLSGANSGIPSIDAQGKFINFPWGQTGGTQITSTSNNQTLPQSTVNVASTAHLPSSGQFVVDGSTVNYTNITSTSFTGCTGGSATLHTGDKVYGTPPQFLLQVDSTYYSNLA